MSMKNFQHILVVLQFLSITCDVPIYNIQTGTLYKLIEVNISTLNTAVIVYYYPSNLTENMPLKVEIEAFVKTNQSILVIFKRDDNFVKSLKLVRSLNEPSSKAVKTISPYFNEILNIKHENRTLSMEISTISLEVIKVIICVKIEKNFLLKMNRDYHLFVNNNGPIIHLFKFDENLENLIVKINSTDNICMILSIQKAQFQVFEDIMDIKKHSQIFQTILKIGQLVVQKKFYFRDQFLLVFALNKNDVDCHSIKKYSKKNISIKQEFRQKIFTVMIESKDTDYYLPVIGAFVFYLLFYILAMVLACIYNKYDVMKVNDLEQGGCFKNVSNSNISYPLQFVEDSCGSTGLKHLFSKNSIYLSDLAKKSPSVLNRKYFLYLWYLVVISVFYGLPVLQLLINYQQTFDITGDQDMCFYNFRCTKPLYIFAAFNNIISNIGYVLLGILLILVTLRRDFLYSEVKRSNNLGIPQYYGLYYAMGVALTMEGVMSACYHICPSRTNFQFDTAYMYILACLCIIKIYQTRHPDINATASTFFVIMALFILIGVVGVVTKNEVFWIIFTIFYLFFCIFITFEIFFFTDWKIDGDLPKRVWEILQECRMSVFKPMYRKRRIVLVAFNIVNCSLILYGIIDRPINFPSFFLTILMTNLFFYFLVYIILKAFFKEKFPLMSIPYVIAGIICWAFAIYCFIKHPTDWMLTPAKSRELNKYCIFLDFYDIHDIWHFLSSLSMFFSFVTLQNIDDCLYKIERNKIPVF